MKDLENNILTKKWRFSWDRRMSYQKMRLFSYAYHHDIPKMFGVNFSSELYRVKDFIVSECYDVSEYEDGFSKIEKRFKRKDSVKLFKLIIKLVEKFGGEFRTYVEKMPVSYESINNKKLLKAYQGYCRAEENISLSNWVLFAPFEEIITRTLKQALLAELKNDDEVDNIIKDISLPCKITPLDFYNKSFYEVALSPKEKKETLFGELEQNFAHWGLFDVIYPGASHESFVKRLSEVENLNARRLIVEIDEKYVQNIAKVNKVLKFWKKNKYILGLLTLYSCYANNKDWKNYYREQSTYKLKILLLEISKRVGLSLNETAFLTEDETAKLLVGEASYSHDEINQRIKNSAFVFLKGKISIITDKDTLSKIDDVITLSKVSEIKGVGAFPGKIRGFARLIISNQDFGKLKLGDILVTSTTRPDYLPLMQKAAAFVTNEGGLLSHAAITARELKKPCIIGTKIATQVIMDGDVIEVDAGSGVVRIIR